jgi:hypothetical protein
MYISWPGHSMLRTNSNSPERRLAVGFKVAMTLKAD